MGTSIEIDKTNFKDVIFLLRKYSNHYMEMIL